MVLCKFWAQGNCRKGNLCNFEHPTNNRQQNNNRGSFGGQARLEKWALNDADIESDLTNTRPKWILSAYGPGKETPAALFVENEYSPEELRWRYYQQAHVGNGDAADREAQQLWQKADNDMLNVARNVRDVSKYMEEKEGVHPNRYDFCKMDGTISREEFISKAAAGMIGGDQGQKLAFGTTPFGQKPSSFGYSAQSSLFGQAKQPSPFGQTSQPSAFGKPAQSSPFGQPAQPSAFGQPTQPSAFGQPAQPSAFGQPSQPSAFGKPAFGQNSGLGQPAFGQTGFGQAASNQTASKFGAPIQNQSPFGAPSAQTGTAFGQSSALGQSASAAPAPAASGFGAGNSFGQPAQPSAFGKPAFGSTAAPAASSPFGGTAAQSNKSPFGGTAQANNASPFGNAAQNQASSAGFGSGNAVNQAATASTLQNANPFSQSQQQQTQQAAPFGQQQPSSQPSNPFGQTRPQPQPQQSPFGQAQQKPLQSSPFGQPLGQQTQQANPFGQTQQPQSSTVAPSPFGQPQQPQHPSSAQNPFGQQPSAGFGAQLQSNIQPTQSAATPFANAGQQSTPGQQAPSGSVQSSKPTDKPVRPLHYSQTLPPGRTLRGPDGQPALYRDKPVQIIKTFRPSANGTEVKDLEFPVYDRPDRTGLERIWFPYGLEEPSIQKLGNTPYDYQETDDQYNERIKEQYGYLFENGGFKDHIIPLVPPERGWIDYDF